VSLPRINGHAELFCGPVLGKAVGAQLVFLQEQEDLDVPAGVVKLAAYHDAVAAVVAGAGKHYGLARREHLLYPVRNGKAGPLHEHGAGHSAVLDGPAVNLLHLLCGDYLHAMLLCPCKI